MKPHAKELAQLLDRLDSELDAAGPVDEISRGRMHALTYDIRELTHTAQPGAAGVEHHSRLQEFASRFEANHPAVASALRELVDALGKAGV
jgi:hypothetical protein